MSIHHSIQNVNCLGRSVWKRHTLPEFGSKARASMRWLSWSCTGNASSNGSESRSEACRSRMLMQSPAAESCNRGGGGVSLRWFPLTG